MADMDTPTSSLLTLNDYCLDNIFKNLSLDELMQILGNVHFIIDFAIERQLYRFRHYYINMRFPPQYSEKQLQALGRHLEGLDINIGYSVKAEEVLNLLQQLFLGAKETRRLRDLKIQHVNITSEYIEGIFPVAPQLRVLNLSCSDIEDQDQLNRLLHSATKLEILALYNKDATNLDKTILSQLQHLKINWLVGTTMFNAVKLCELYPNLSISVYQSNNVELYGPPVARKKKDFINY